MCMRVFSACVYVYPVHALCLGGQKRGPGLLELELWWLWATMWMLDTESEFTGRAATALNLGLISLAPGGHLISGTVRQGRNAWVLNLVVLNISMLRILCWEFGWGSLGMVYFCPVITGMAHLLGHAGTVLLGPCIWGCESDTQLSQLFFFLLMSCLPLPGLTCAT